MEAVTTYKHSYILVARELQLKDARIAELTAAASGAPETGSPTKRASEGVADGPAKALLEQVRTLTDELEVLRRQHEELRAQLDSKSTEAEESMRSTIRLQKVFIFFFHVLVI